MPQTASAQSYAELIATLYRLITQPKTKEWDLNIARALNRYVGSPDSAYPTIHVAGTNGKGSVSTKIATALQAEGLSVGLFTSPHLSTFRERMRINGELVSEEEVEALLPLLLEARDAVAPLASFFEVTTILAFLFFARHKVDVAVIETGLGGRLDATNIITPILSVITSISIEHTQQLGNTVEAITREKAGIIKSTIPIVIGPTVPRSLIDPIASERCSPLTVIDTHFASYEEENCAVAAASLNLLRTHFPLSPQAIETGLRSSPSCRMELIQYGGVTIVLDVAHNPAALRALTSSLRARFPGTSFRFVVGFSAGKELNACFAEVVTLSNQIHLVEAPTRGATLQQMSEALPIPSYSIGTSIGEEVGAAVKLAKEHNEVVVICGSFFLMSEVRQALQLEHPTDPHLLIEQFM